MGINDSSRLMWTETETDFLFINVHTLNDSFGLAKDVMYGKINVSSRKFLQNYYDHIHFITGLTNLSCMLYSQGEIASL